MKLSRVSTCAGGDPRRAAKVAKLEDDPVMMLMDLGVWVCVFGVAAAADHEDRRRRRRLGF
jgi:hypothetical protein